MRIMSYALVVKPGMRSEFLGQVRSLVANLVAGEKVSSVRLLPVGDMVGMEDGAQGFGTPINITITIDSTAFNSGEGKAGPLATAASLNLPKLPEPKVKGRPFRSR